MFYRNLKTYGSAKFKRLTGVSPEVFALLVEVLVAGLRAFGRPPTLCLEDRLLMVLMYWREYRTLEHIGETYGVSEATVSRTVQQFEDILIKRPTPASARQESTSRERGGVGGRSDRRDRVCV